MQTSKLTLAALALASAGLAGCASQQPQADNSAQMADLQSRLTRAEQAASDAQAAAARAEARANECMAAADQKVDRAFKKSQQK
jgi:outer membrane murein-binding lipoprotein Lpp